MRPKKMYMSILLTLTLPLLSFAQEFEVDQFTLALWHLNEGSGTIVNDVSGNGNTGSVVGASWTSGRFGTGLDFGASNDHVRVNDSPSLSAIGDELTIEFYIWLDYYPGVQNPILGKWGSLDEYIVQINRDGRLASSFYGTSGDVKNFSNQTPLPRSQWNYVAIVFDGSNGELSYFLNYQLDGQTNVSFSLDRDTNAPFILGKVGGNLDFNGKLDEVRISGRARSIIPGPQLVGHTIVDHLAEELEQTEDDSFFQQLYETIKSYFEGPNSVLGDVTVELELSDATNIRSVEAKLTSPDDPDYEVMAQFEADQGKWKQRIELTAEGEIGLLAFIDLILLMLRGTTVNPFMAVGIEAPRVGINQLQVEMTDGSSFIIDTRIELPTWDRRIDEHLNAVPQPRGGWGVIALSPIDILVQDSQGRQVGLENGQHFLEIPFSVSSGDGEPEGILILGNEAEEYELTLQGTGSGTFTLEFIQYTQASSSDPRRITYEDVPVSSSAIFSGTVGALVRDYTLAVDAEGDGSFESSITPTTVVSVEDEVSVPLTIQLRQNFPNPFKSVTTISYSLPASQHVTLAVYDLLGRKVATLVDKFDTAGYHQAVFDASKLPSGSYTYRLQAGEYTEAKVLILLK